MSKTKEIIDYIRNEYSVTNPNDIVKALKDLLGDTLQTMLYELFNDHMGYDIKYII